MTEQLPGLSRLLEQHKESQLHSELKDLQEAAKKKEQEELALADYQYLKNSPVLELMRQAGNILASIHSGGVRFGITDIEHKPLGPIHLKLIWNITSKGIYETDGSLVGETDSYEEVNASVLRDARGKVKKLQFNVGEGRNPQIVSPSEKQLIAVAIDYAALHPVYYHDSHIPWLDSIPLKTTENN